jgi:DNA (cytosine-5)-methyltransferase 1
VAELFAGVGGFRLGLEAAQSGWQVVWSDQWEPGSSKQWASDAYVRHFGAEGHHNEDISAITSRLAADPSVVADHDLLVGGFPCQDYSVAKTLHQSAGIAGKKGVLWWDIHRVLEAKRPRAILLENVDRLLKSPASQRGRDFAIVLSSLSGLGYDVEWRVINAADYGFPQRRRRVFIVGRPAGSFAGRNPLDVMLSEGVLAKALPVLSDAGTLTSIELSSDLTKLTDHFGAGGGASPFKNAGIMIDGAVNTAEVKPDPTAAQADGPHLLRDVLVDEVDVPASFFIDESALPAWDFIKGAKRFDRLHASGGAYTYSEGAVPFPDPIDRPSRTILTSEGGSSANRSRHVVRTPSGRLRRLLPIELEALDGFPPDWTAGMPDTKRAFMMGNALVVGVVTRIGQALGDALDAEDERLSMAA